MLKRFAKKHFKKWNGILLFYSIYDPRLDDKNVISHMLHPDLRNEPDIEELMQELAGRIRMFYRDNPKLLEEVGQKIDE